MAEAAQERPEPDVALWLGAEAAGAGLIAFFIIAAGILGERFAGGNIMLAMVATCLTGAAAFAVLARVLSGVAVAAFNPAVALALLLGGRWGLLQAVLSAAAQISGAFLGVMIAHLVTNMGLVQVASQIQTGSGIWIGELVASALFVLVIFTAGARAPLAGAASLLAISLATPSLSFANPAVTLARALTDSFTAIRLEDAALIAAIQFAGAVAAYVLARVLLPHHIACGKA